MSKQIPESTMTEKKPRFEVVKTEAGHFKVIDTTTRKDMTIPIADKSIANEICDDFNKMDNKDFSPLFKT